MKNTKLRACRNVRLQGMIYVGVIFTIIAVTDLSARAASSTSDTAQAQSQAHALIDKGLDYLRTRQQPDGGWQKAQEPPGITAIVLRAFVEDGNYTAQTDFVKRGFDKLFSYQLDSGGIYKDLLANYNTAIAVSAIAAADDPAFKTRLDRAVAFLKGLQWTDNSVTPKGQKVDKNNTWYGGWGYGREERPDLSNAQFAIEVAARCGPQEGRSRLQGRDRLPLANSEFIRNQ